MNAHDEQDRLVGQALRLLRRAADDNGWYVTVVQEHDRWAVRVLGSDGRLITRCDSTDRLDRNADMARERVDVLRLLTA